MITTKYYRAQHAAHYMYMPPGNGHDLESWDFVGDKNAPPSDVPKDAKYHSGMMVDGVQWWRFVRIAPLTGACAICGVSL
ncbi:MAG TPA: hypothetical protein DCQ33_12760 [Nitrospira sp.]|nr:hypothetical protein [Nitrospira sp.]